MTVFGDPVYVVTYHEEAVGIWVCKWSFLISLFSFSCQGERYEDIDSALLSLGGSDNIRGQPIVFRSVRHRLANPQLSSSPSA